MLKNKIFFQRNFFWFLVVCFLTILVAFFGTIFWLRSQKKLLEEKPHISERSEEFIQSQKSQSGSIWQEYDPVGKGEEGANEFQAIFTSCFTSDLPTRARSIKKQEDEKGCLVTSTIDEPSGFITISLKFVPQLTSLEEDTGVALRMREDTTYTFDDSFFENTKNSRTFYSQNEITYFRLEDSTLLVISLYDLAKITPEVKQLLRSLIASVAIQ